MPRPPSIASHIAAMPGGVFSKFADRIARIEGERFPLHIGDTYMEPIAGARMGDLDSAQIDGLHRYTSPKGHKGLISALAAKHRIGEGRILVCAGATGGLHATGTTLLDPGDEVLLLSPNWPLISGIVRTAHAKAVQVPYFGEEGSVADRIAPYITDRTVAIYLNSPNNPTGIALDQPEMEALAELARARDLWIWSDEVYDGLVYNGEHIYISELAPERTIAVHSFSKTYGMAGNRCGYITGPQEIVRAIQKVLRYTFYSASTASQIAALHAIENGKPWLDRAREFYRQAGVAAADTLGVPHPDGSTFLFLDVTPYLDETGTDGFLMDCLDRNLILAPGSSFGPLYESFVRVCYTCIPPDRVAKGIQVLREVMDSRS
jgi:aspartate/methionine/tyrosine aminotransferase